MPVRARRRGALQMLCLISLLCFVPSLFAGDEIPQAAWKRGIGQPLANAGARKPSLASSGMIDDGYWQGSPVGGFGAGTFSRTYRGDFARWHLKSGAHKYETVWTNQFAMYQQPEGGKAVAQVLTAAHPDDPNRSLLLDLGLPGWRGRLLRTLSQVLV